MQVSIYKRFNPRRPASSLYKNAPTANRRFWDRVYIRLSLIKTHARFHLHHDFKRRAGKNIISL